MGSLDARARDDDARARRVASRETIARGVERVEEAFRRRAASSVGGIERRARGRGRVRGVWCARFSHPAI